MKFAPLHIISGYSFLQSGLTMEKITSSVKTLDYFGAAISDNEVMYGLAPLWENMKKINKPYLFGEEFSINGDTLCLYVINETGYHNLLKINHEAQAEGLTLSFLKDNNEGLVAILETVRGTFKEKFVEDYDQSFNKYLLEYSSLFSDRFYLGIEVTSREEVKYANRVRKFADEFTYPCIAFPRIRYQKKEDAITLLMTDAIANDNKINVKKLDGQDYFMKEEDYQKIYSKVELDNTINVMKMSTFDFEKKRGELLHYPVSDAKESLREICEKALKEKSLNDEEHLSRLNHELEVIFQMGYADYFLIVQDYVNYAKTHDILVGPGRGSAAGSLVSYLLNITEVDPLKYDLQFERFLNPYRQTMPDIDVDFMDIKRDLMFKYMREKYGPNRVGNIVTFQTIGAKQALRDVGRIYEYPDRWINALSRAITLKDCSLREAYKKLPDFRKLVDDGSYCLEIVTLASKLEGLPRQSGLHPAGVVLDDKPLEESIPVSVYLNDNYVSQYEMQYLEQQGLLKMDFLSLSNLTTIYNCVALINARHKDVNLKCDEIPYDVKEIFDLISQNKTMGLFQIETEAMRKSIEVLKPNCFDDIIAVLALGRPGPMKYIPSYVNRKLGKEKYSLLSEDLKDILAPTYGIIVYQEQINNIAVKMAGFSLGEADMFRRAGSKKEKDKLLKLEKRFVDGAKEKGYDQNTAKKVFDDILRFAEYGFNKSHSVVYAIITCRMAYLKAHYPLEFYASLLGGSAASNDSKFNDYIAEMNTLGIKMLPPSINYSTSYFAIKGNDLLFPLTAIKGINITLMDKIEEERNENGLFKDYFDFVLRMYAKGINEGHVIALIEAGALDELYNSRASMKLNVKAALQYAELNHSDNGQLSIGISAFPKPKMRQEDDNPLENLDHEYEVIGVMLSDNPLRYKKELLEKENVSSINQAKLVNSSTIAGIIRSKKVINTQKGDKMAYIKIFDETDEIELTIFPRVYTECLSILDKNNIIIVKMKKNSSKGETSYIADEIKLLEEEKADA